MTSYTATMTKVQDAQPLGTYKPTSIDARKEEADIRIMGVDGTFTLYSKVPLRGRGIKQPSPERRPDWYEVTHNALARIQTQHTVETDF